MWRYQNLPAFVGSLLLVGGWWQLVAFAQAHLDLTSRVEAVIAATFVAHVGVRFVEAARADSQSIPRQFLSGKLLLTGATISIGVAGIFEWFHAVESYDRILAFLPVILIVLGLIVLGRFLFKALNARHSPSDRIALLSRGIILAAAAIMYFGATGVIRHGQWIGWGAAILGALMYFLKDSSVFRSASSKSPS